MSRNLLIIAIIGALTLALGAPQVQAAERDSKSYSLYFDGNNLGVGFDRHKGSSDGRHDRHGDYNGRDYSVFVNLPLNSYSGYDRYYTQTSPSASYSSLRYASDRYDRTSRDRRPTTYDRRPAYDRRPSSERPPNDHWNRPSSYNSKYHYNKYHHNDWDWGHSSSWYRPYRPSHSSYAKFWISGCYVYDSVQVFSHYETVWVSGYYGGGHYVQRPVYCTQTKRVWKPGHWSYR
ncbi:hypothetical protein JXA32_13305 [Candidatus Sumerlaeota bacterium]|nr:hypothetical protein [Candidatus Sumerlaeota bacterium]